MLLRENTSEFNMQAPVGQKMESDDIYWIHLFPLDNAVVFPNSYPLNNDFQLDSAIHVLNTHQNDFDQM